MVFDLTDYAEAIKSALADGKPCTLATVGPQGLPNIGFKGSMMVFDKYRLAYWERTRGVHLGNLRGSPHVAVLYFNADRQLYLRVFGVATIFEQGRLREEIMARVVGPELQQDSERGGYGVLIEVHTVVDAAKARSLHRSER